MRFIGRGSRRLVTLTGISLGLIHIGLQTSSAQPLAVAHIQNGTVGSASIITSFTVYVGFGLNTNAVLFDQFALTPADVGRTFTLNASNDPDFLDAKFSLENGAPDAVVFGEVFGFTGLTSEANFFNPLPVGSNGIDFQGFSIGSIALTVDALTLTSPGTNPNGNGIWTDIYFRGTISVYAVPEPATFSMVGLGGLVFLSAFHRCRIKSRSQV